MSTFIPFNPDSIHRIGLSRVFPRQNISFTWHPPLNTLDRSCTAEAGNATGKMGQVGTQDKNHRGSAQPAESAEGPGALPGLE
jgi:hypothetical protein